MKFLIRVNESNLITIDPEILLQVDILHSASDRLKFRHEGKNHNIQIREVENEGKKQLISYQGKNYHIEINDELDQLIEEIGLHQNHHSFARDVHSPMPGLVVDILVGEGDLINKGDNLIILEAMKMENILKAEGEGTIDKIVVERGQKVDKAQLLISLKPD